MVTTLSLDWIKKINPYYWDTLLEDEERLVTAIEKEISDSF